MNFKDLYEKSEKAIYTEGPTFLNVMTPCPRGWGYPTDMLMQINKLAVDTCYWPLYEVIDGKYKINYKLVVRKDVCHALHALPQGSMLNTDRP